MRISYIHLSCANTNTVTSSVIPVSVVTSRQMISMRRSAYVNRRLDAQPSIAISKLWQKTGYSEDSRESMERPTMSAMTRPTHTLSMRKLEYFVIFRWKTSQSRIFRQDMKSQKSVSRSDSVRLKYPILSYVKKTTKTISETSRHRDHASLEKSRKITPPR